MAEPMGGGLINTTWAVRRAGRLVAVLQRLNTAVFTPRVHLDIEAVTSHLAARGLPTPRLLRTRTGGLWHEDDTGVWRAFSPIGDATHDSLDGPARARAAGALVARFHAAVADFSGEFASVRPGAHDTEAHLERLRQAIAAFPNHRLVDRVAPLAERIFAAWSAWSGPGPLPRRVIHGDLKISNIRWQGAEAVALVDLDTLAWGTLDIELGDALRSWCNPDREDAPSSGFRADLFSAALEGYAEAAARGRAPPTAAEWRSLVPGVERICLELAARFAQDALAESYFGFDPRFGGRGEHNLVRAEGQVALASSVRAQRADLDAIVARVAALGSASDGAPATGAPGAPPG